MLTLVRLTPFLMVLVAPMATAATRAPRVAVLEFTGDGARQRSQVVRALRARHFLVVTSVDGNQTPTRLRQVAADQGINAYVQGAVTGASRHAVLLVHVVNVRSGARVGTARFVGDKKRLEWDFAANFWKRLGPAVKRATAASPHARLLADRRANAHMEPTGQPAVAARRASTQSSADEEDEPLAPGAKLGDDDDDDDDADDDRSTSEGDTGGADTDLHRRLDPDGRGAGRAQSFDLALGMHLFTRHFRYLDPVGTLTPYRLLWAPAPAGTLDWFWADNLGLTAHGQIETGATTTDRDGTSFPTAHWAFGGGLKARAALGPVWLSAVGEYGVETFSIDSPAPETPKPPVPSVRYQYLRAGGALRWNATSYLAFYLGGGYRHVLSAGEVASDLYFPHASVRAVDASAMLAVRLLRGLELRIAADARRYTLEMRSQPRDIRQARGAVDDYVGGTVSLAVMVGGRRGF